MQSPLDQAIALTQQELREENCPPATAQLAADLSRLLWGNVHPPGAVASYEEMLRLLARGRRWRMLVAQFRPLHRRRREAELRQQRERKDAADQPQLDPAVVVSRFVVKYLAYRLVHLCTASAPGPCVVDLQQIGDGFRAWQNDNVHAVDAYIMVGSAIVQRAKLTQFLDQWLNRDLILACLAEDWTLENHEPRPLRRILQEGSQEARLAGDLSSVRGVTVKNREDQLKDIIPSEWVLCKYKDAAGDADKDKFVRVMGLKHIWDEHPLILEHHQPMRPEVRQRLLLMMIVGAEQQRETHAATGASLRAHRLAYDMLVTAGLEAAPHASKLSVDVVWFERRDAQWLGQTFPLLSLKLQSELAENWRNVVEVDRVLPHFFVRWPEGAAAGSRRGQPFLRESPSVHLERAVTRHLYDGVVLAAVMRNQERGLCLPPPSALLPRVDKQSNAVMLATVSDNESELRGDVFHDLLSAGVASLPLKTASDSELIGELVTMLVGPVANDRKLSGWSRVSPTSGGGKLQR